jgi:hypothetical protein
LGKRERERERICTLCDWALLRGRLREAEIIVDGSRRIPSIKD